MARGETKNVQALSREKKDRFLTGMLSWRYLRYETGIWEFASRVYNKNISLIDIVRSHPDI